jgi:hypothetical protein
MNHLNIFTSKVEIVPSELLLAQIDAFSRVDALGNHLEDSLESTQSLSNEYGESVQVR